MNLCQQLFNGARFSADSKNGAPSPDQNQWHTAPQPSRGRSGERDLPPSLPLLAPNPRRNPLPSPRSFLLHMLYEMRTPPPCRDCGDPTAKRLVASEAFLLPRCLVRITRSASRRAVEIVPVPRARVSDGGPQSCSASDSSELCLRVTCQSFRRGTSLLVIKWIASCFCSTSSLIHSLIRIGSYNFE